MKERLGNHLVERSLDDESKKKFEHMQKKTCRKRGEFKDQHDRSSVGIK